MKLNKKPITSLIEGHIQKKLGDLLSLFNIFIYEKIIILLLVEAPSPQ
jgi:hypothetical protein